MKTLIFLALALCACGAGAQPAAKYAPPPARALCYAKADAAAQTRVDAECKGLAFPQCPAHDSILAGLKAAEEACK